MKKAITSILQVVICLITLSVLAAMIRFPQTEGRAANLDPVSIYSDPFIIYGYLASIPFFVGLYQAFKLLGYLGAKKVNAKAASNALKNIKYASLVFIGFIALGEAMLVMNATNDDVAGTVALGIYTTVLFAIIATTATFFQKRVLSVKK